VDGAVSEVGSALNVKRRKFFVLFNDREVTTIIVEHRDRFSRLRDEYVSAALETTGRLLVVVNYSEVDDDLV